ncbi:MAG: hypothetical protein HYV41_01480 [Candidatus Magasanikbacteria bacterium]|nr:hypothetical protein [Candidatus Magasanikbacteria bacterium]
MKNTTIWLIIAITIIFPFSVVHTQDEATTTEQTSQAPEEFPDFEPTQEISQEAQDDPFQLGPIDNSILLGRAELPEIVANLINVALSLLGIILLVLILWSGLLWMTSGGDDEKVKKARATLVGAIIGLIIILMSGSIVTFLIDALSLATGGGSNTDF